jgi:hypothetical protein
MTHAESNDDAVEALSDDDLAEDVSVGDLEEAIVRARAGNATEQDISDLIANAAQGEYVGVTSPTEPKDLAALSDENNERLADADAAGEQALVDAEASRESVKLQAKEQVEAARAEKDEDES